MKLPSLLLLFVLATAASAMAQQNYASFAQNLANEINALHLDQNWIYVGATKNALGWTSYSITDTTVNRTVVVAYADPSGVARTAIIGDSITFGFPFARLTPDISTLNVGISGIDCHQAVDYLKKDALPWRPDTLVIACGTNDIAHGRRLSDIETDLWSMMSTARRAGIRVVLATVPPMANAVISGRNLASLAAPIENLNLWIRQTASSQRLGVWERWYPLVEGASGFCYVPYFSSDGIHPNSTGQIVLLGGNLRYVLR